jgi:hypothetical protein
MPRAKSFDTTFFCKRGWTAIARIQNPDGNNATQGSLTSVKCIVQRAKAPGTPTYNAVLTKASVIFDTLQKAADDARWDKDGVGFNFRFEVPASAFPKSGDNYVVEFTFTPTAGEPYSLIYEGGCKSTYNS